MSRTGWFRLWTVAIAGLSVAFLGIAAYTIWGKDACYRYVSISTKGESVADEDIKIVEQLRHEANMREYCGTTQYSTLLTLEELAKRGVVTQVGIQWREPEGWSFGDFDTLDIVEGPEIRASTVLEHVRRSVGVARLRTLIPWVIALVATAVGSLALGCSIAWVRRGFQSN